MVDLLLILLGERVIRQRWPALLGFGLLWTILGGFFFVNALHEEARFNTLFFVVPLLIDALITLFSAFGSTGTRRSFRLAKCGVFFVIALLIIFKPGGSDITIGILVGVYLLASASFRAFSAWVVRFRRWRRSLVIAGVEFLLGLWAFVPWPTYWQGEVGLDVGMLIAFTGANLVSLSLRMRRLPPGVPMARLLSEGWPEDSLHGPQRSAPGNPWSKRGDLTVHVWTPTGAMAPLTRGVERYIAATDPNGVVSTGHAALEVFPEIYISHYPAREIDATPGDFAKTLRATRENDQPGRWLPSYAEESDQWRPSTIQLLFEDVDLEALRRFWGAYQLDDTYNLTNRNCSCAVAKALDVAIEGAFASVARSPRLLLRLMLLPELWTAGWLRYQAMAMAWTPGIVLDYARSLHTVLDLRRSLEPAGKP